MGVYVCTCLKQTDKNLLNRTFLQKFSIKVLTNRYRGGVGYLQLTYLEERNDMKKSILIGVLAALMLFAFTACENGTVTVDYIKQVYATNNAETAYLPGETVNLTDYTFTALMYDGRTVTVDASDIVFDSLVVPADATAASTIDGTYKGASDFPVKLAFNYAKVADDGITMDASAVATKQYIAAVAEASKDEFKDKSLKFDGIEFTVKYTDENNVKGEKTITVADVAEEFITGAVQASGSNTWTLSGDEVKAGSASRDVKVSYNTTEAGTYKVTLVPNYISGLELKATDGYKVYRDGKVEAGKVLDYSVDKKAAGIYLEATYDNGETAVVTESEVSYVGQNNAEIDDVADIEIPATGNSVPVTAKYTGEALGIGVSDTAAALAVTVENDKIVDLKFAGIPTTLVQGDYSKEGVLSTALTASFTVTPVYESDPTNTSSQAALKCTANGDGYVFTAPADLDLSEVTGRTEFTVKATVGTLTFEKSFTTVITEA